MPEPTTARKRRKRTDARAFVTFPEDCWAYLSYLKDELGMGNEAQTIRFLVMEALRARGMDKTALRQWHQARTAGLPEQASVPTAAAL